LVAFLLAAGACISGSASAAHSKEGATASLEGSGLPFPHRKLSNVTFVAFDTETTGLNPRQDRIVELAAVKFRDGEIVDQKTWLINPRRTIPYWAQKVHGISTAMVKDQPTFAELYPEFERFIEGSVLIAHNARFDISFMREEMLRSNLSFPRNQVVDSLELFRSWYPELKTFTLEKLAEHANVDSGGFHRALADSRYIALIFRDGAKRFHGSAKLNDVYAAVGGPLSF